ncbi:MAG: DUF3488 and DUF4129 domain-containing transglutaminase family protein [Desulfobacterales bacterium]
MNNDDRKYIPALTGALIVAILPHAATLPLWITTWCALMWGYLLASLRFAWPRPGRKTRVLLSIAGIAGLLATYSTRLGPESYLGLLAVMAALKPFEGSTHRDRMITVFIAYFIIISKLLQSETFAVTIYMFFSVLVTTAALIRINDPYGGYRSGMKKAGIILAQAAPLMIVLFILFPRIEGSLIGMQHSGEAKTGFSDQLSPGSISKLAQNDETAFRAQFKGPIPPPDTHYWRGVVFVGFDGRNWQKAKRVPELKNKPRGENTVKYTVSLEPHNSRWLFALDIPVKAPSKSDTLRRDFTVQAGRAVTRKRRYEMVSRTKYEARAGSRGVEEASGLPENTNPETRKLGKNLAEDSQEPEQIVEKGLEYLKEKEFSYTLEPALLGQDPVDEFLFESRQGFCEHFASAFAVLMRAAGVPARVVGGYLGGEINPFAGHLIIRQSDAHAWVEVWYPDKGWTRVDPTVAVAPQRLEQGAGGVLSGEGKEGGLAGRYLSPVNYLIKRVKLGWDAVSLQWEALFAGYSRDSQMALLKKIGIHWQSWKTPAAALGLGLVLAAVITALYWLIQLQGPVPRKRDPVKKQYEKFCTKLARAGISRSPDTGPREFAEFCAARLPLHKDKIHEITETYIRLKYKKDQDPEDAKRLRAMVRTFNPGPADYRNPEAFDAGLQQD